MKKLFLFLIIAASAAFGQTITSVTGTVKDLTGANVTSGQVTFTLQPGIDTSMSGIARFSPSEVDCTITGAGLIKALDGVSTCTVVNNTSLQPSGTSYKVCLQPQFAAPGSCFNWFATGGSFDLTQQIPTPPLAPTYTLVDTFSNQTIAGNKTFTGNVTYNGLLTFGAFNASGLLTALAGIVSTDESLSGALNVAGPSTLAAINAESVNGVCEADQQTGADAAAKIKTCITAGPSTGVVVDTRGFQGNQTGAIDPFVGAGKPVTLLFGEFTLTTSACWSLPSKTNILGSGWGLSTLKLANGINNCYVIQNSDVVSGNDHITVEGITIDGNALNQSPNEGTGQRTGTIKFFNVQYFNISNNELKNAYHYHAEIQGSSRHGWVRNNRIDGSINGSGILFGNSPFAINGGILGTEAHDMHADGNDMSNVGGGDCLFSTGSDTAGSYGTSNIHFGENHLFNCGDVSIEIGDGTTDAIAVGNTVTVAPSLTITAISRTSNVVTATVSCSWSSRTDMGCLTAFRDATHGSGAPFSVAGVSDSSFNNSPCTVGVNCFTVLTANYATNTITYAQTAANASSSGGTITRSGNLAFLARSAQNVKFTGNTERGNVLAGAQDCELAWHNAGDSVSTANNIAFDDVCQNNGRNGFSIAADASGTVTQVNNSTKFSGTTSNDYVLGSNGLAIRLLGAGGFITSGNFGAGTSFNQSNDLTFGPASGNNIHLVLGGSGGISAGVGSFSPNAGTFHYRTGGNLQAFLCEATAAADCGYSAKNTSQTWAWGVRNGLGNNWVLRDITNSVDVLQITPLTGNASFLGSLAALGNLNLTEAAAPSGVASHDILYADPTAHRLKMVNNNGTPDTVAGLADFAAPPAIGNTTPAAVTGTTITANTGFVSGNVTLNQGHVVTQITSQCPNTFGAGPATFAIPGWGTSWNVGNCTTARTAANDGILSSSGTLMNLAMNCGTTGVGAGSGVLKVLIDGTPSALTVTYGTTTATTPVLDTTHTASYTAGHRIAFTVDTIAAETLANCKVSLELH